jgi:hypothetical protein
MARGTVGCEVGELPLSVERVERLDGASHPRRADYPCGGRGIQQRIRRIDGGC